MREIRKRALRGGAWLAAGSIGENGLRALRTMILTRLLAPEAFGIIAIVMAVTQLFEALTQVGIREGIIQSPVGRERAYLNAAQLASIARAFVLFALGYAGVPIVADFYGHAELAPMLRLALLGLIFNGAASVRAYVLQKDLEYGRWIVIQNGGSALGIFVTIGLAIQTGSAWALVIGYVAEAASRCLLSYVLCPFLPRFQFERRALADLFAYSRGYFGIPITAYVSQRMDVFVLGKLVSVEQLGLYSVALGFAQIPVSLAMGFVNPVLLPTYAQVQADPIAFGRRVLRSTRYLALAFLPLLALMAGGAATLLELLYGAQYAVMDVVLVLLCIGVAARIMGWTFGTAYLAGGVPGLQRTTSLIRFFLKGIAIVPFTLLWGLEGAAVAGIVPHLAALIYNLKTIRPLAVVSPAAYARALAPALLLTLCLGLGWAVFVRVH